MDAHSAGNVTTVVIEMEPGKVFVKIADPKPPAHRIEFFLRRAVEDWFKARPAFVVDRSEAFADQGEIVGLHVWYHAAEHQSQSMRPSQPLSDSFTIDVHSLIAKQHSREYIEAVLDDAMTILQSYQHRRDTLVVINRRRIAVILDKQLQRGTVIPVDMIEQVVEGPMKSKLLTWLASPATPFYVIHIAGSWFSQT